MDRFKLPSQHARALWIAAPIMMIAIVVMALWSEFLPVSDHVIKGLINAGLAVVGSTLAAALVPLALHLYAHLERRNTRAKFARFFRLSEETRPIFVLPRFKVGRSEKETEDHGINGICLKQLDELDRNCVSFDDIVATRHLTTMFAENSVHSPRIFFDDDVWKVVFGETALSDEKRYKEIRDCRSFIVIGIFSNALTTSINKSLEISRSFRLSDPPSAVAGQRNIEIAPISIKSLDLLEKWRAKPGPFLTTPSASRFGLLARVALPGDREAFILGGGTARATRKSASYLLKNWAQLYDYRAPERTARLGANAFAMELIVPDADDSSPLLGRTFYLDPNGH